MTTQKQLKTKLEALSIGHKRIDVYGSQIVVTTYGEDSARKWASVLGRFATVRGVIKTRDETQDPSEYFAANPGLVKQSFSHTVWRTFATV